MLVITLARRGRKKLPFYHLIVRDKRSKRDSGIDTIGYFDPLLPNDDPKRASIQEDKLNKWLGVGAKMSSTVNNLCKKVLKTSVTE